MKPFSSLLLILGIVGGAFAQDSSSPQIETAPAETEIIGPIADGTPAEPLPEKEPIPFQVLSSVTKRGGGSGQESHESGGASDSAK